MNLWLYLHFPSLQLDAMYQQPDTQAQPMIIVDEKKNEVIQLNSFALTEGIKIGMGLGSAASLCPELQVKPYEQTTENIILKRIAHWLYSLTADIALYPPNGLLIKVTSMLSLHQDLNHYWHLLSIHLNHLSYTYSYATAYSPYAARMLAKQQLNQISDNKIWLKKQLEKQSLTNTELAPKIIHRLQKVGVKTLANLLSLSPAELSKRFNLDVVNYIGRLMGNISHHINFYIPPENFEHYLELHYEVSNSQYLTKPLLKLYTLLAHHLTLKDKLANEVSLILHQRDCEGLSLTISATKGEYKANKWLQLTTLKLESVALTTPVIGITLKTKRITSKYAQSIDLFQGAQGNVTKEELVAVLTAKLGQDKVKGLKVIQDHRPEVANQLCSPLTEQSTPNVNKLRPSILLPSPLHLNEQVTLMPYPERIVTGWWDNNHTVRDYFIGRNEKGQWLWVFKDKNRNWFIHGVFS